MVKAVAEQRGWRHDGHGGLYQVVTRLAQEVDDREIRVMFNSASALHSNFYENWMPKEMIADSLIEVSQFLERLEDLG
jgi:hypothetical protein